MQTVSAITCECDEQLMRASHGAVANAREWMDIGETANIRERLVEHITEFATPERHHELIPQYDHVCNRELDFTRRRKT